MKEATGEVSMTIVAIVAIGLIGLIVASQWDNITGTITSIWSDQTDQGCSGGQHRVCDATGNNCQCIG